MDKWVCANKLSLNINKTAFVFAPLKPSLMVTELTFSRPGGHRCPLSPIFQFYFKKGSSKKFPMSVVPMSR